MAAKSDTKKQVKLLNELKEQVDLVYRQLNEYRGTCRSVDRLNRTVKGILYEEHIRHQVTDTKDVLLDHNRLLIEFVKFKQNYRVSRKKLRKLDRQLLTVNLYDKLYDLYESLVNGESIGTGEDLTDSSAIEPAAVVDEVGCSGPVENQDNPLDNQDYQCSQCDKSFNDWTNFSQHMRIHESEPRFRCTWEGCDFRTNHSNRLKTHEMTIHTNNRPYQCGMCNKSFKHSSNLSLHKRTHAKEPRFKCNWEGCDYGTQYHTCLKNHEMSFHANDRPFQCSWVGCHYRTHLHSSLMYHQKVHTGEYITNPDALTMDDNLTTKPNDTPPNAIKTELYDELYDMYESLVEVETNENENGEDSIDSTGIDPALVVEVGCSGSMEVEDDTPVENFEPNPIDPNSDDSIEIESDTRQLENFNLANTSGDSHSFQMNDLNDSAHSVNSEQFQCSQCDKSFKTQEILIIHNLSHDSVPRYKCVVEGCDFVTDRHSHLKTHEMSVHTGERPFQCSQCSKSFKHSSNLSIHKRTHINEPRYRCSRTGCDYGTQYLNSLKIHEMRIHTGERAFQCDQCQKSFTDSSNLSQHKRIHESEFRFYCNWEGCDFRTNHSNSIKTHQITVHINDRPFQCCWDGCDFRANRFDNLKAHVMGIHTDQRPYQCPFCDKSFKYSSNLSQHKRIHERESRFRCSWDGCEYSSNQFHHLDYHYKSEHVNQG